MALPIFQATVVNDSGDIIPSPEITVVIESSGLPATLFSDRNGTVPLGTGGVFFGGVDGFAQFYATPNDYRVTASDAGSGFSITWRYNMLNGTMALVDAQTSPTDATAGRGLLTDALGENGGPIFTESNLNPNVFGGLITGDFIGNGSAKSATAAIFTLPIASHTAPSSLTLVGTFNVVDSAGATVTGGTGITPVLSTASGNRLVVLDVTGLAITNKEPLYLRQNSNTSKITVNF